MDSQESQIDLLMQVKQNLSCSQYLTRSKSGLYCCPKCGSGTGPHATGAVKLYPVSNTWYCHACQESGDVLDLIRQKEQVDFKTAFEIAKKQLFRQKQLDQTKPFKQEQENALPVEEDMAEEKQRDNVQTTEGTDSEEDDYTEYYRSRSLQIDDPMAIVFLKSRGILPETVKKYQIGFDKSWISPTILKRVRESASAFNSVCVPAPMPRLIIPISKSSYIARAVFSDSQVPYYNVGHAGLFLPDALYNGQKAVFVTEGVFDALSVIQCGGNALALNSTGNMALLVDQLQNKPTKTTLLLALDNDKPGWTAGKKLQQELKLLDIPFQVAHLSGEYKDPNEHLQKDEVEFKKAVKSALENVVSFEEAAEGTERTQMKSFLSRVSSDLYKPCSTHLAFLDELLEGGIPNQTLTLVMAAPAIGKTALCQQMADAMAESKRKVVYFNFEMSWDQLVARSLSSRLKKHNCCIPANKILWHKDWSEEETRRIEEQAEAYEEVLSYLTYNPEGVTNKLESVLAYLERLGAVAKKRNEQAPVVFVDYLQLIGTAKNWDRQELIKQTVLGLKDYAKKYDTFVVAVVATNRTSNTNGSITIESGRDSSNIEYTGDCIISLNYTDLDQRHVSATDSEQVAKLQEQSPRKITIRLLKSRFTASGKSRQILFDPASNLFLAKDHETLSDDPKVIRKRL